MAYRNAHGGGCCGRYHIASFGVSQVNRASGRYEPISDARVKSLTHGAMCGEVCLTATQLRTDAVLAQRLSDNGFKLVYAFRNPNSGNVVYVFLRSTAEVPLAALPFTWGGAVADGVDASVGYRRVYARGGARGWYPSEEAARRGAGPTLVRVERVRRVLTTTSTFETVERED